MVQVSSDAVNNKHLFSNYYLENQISHTLEWGKEDHISAFHKIKEIFDRELPFAAKLSESQLEDRFFREIFKVILPHYEVQGVTQTQEFPDYAFFPDKQSQDRAQSHKDTESFFKEAIVVGEVKTWDAELDRFGKDRHDKRRNPSYQIWLYLHETEPKWGILSNGRKWRLYHEDKPLDVYYEIDLASILGREDLEDFKYFYYFFRKEAFLGNEKGEIFLEVVLKGSADYAQEIGENLKENVYRAMKKIAEGFFTWNGNNLDFNNPASRAIVQKNTMILLYRFLFLLYAEGKSLLNLRDERYREFYSFDRIKKTVASREDGPQSGHYLSSKTSLLGDLRDLFRLINLGSKEVGIEDQIHVPAYNGGLFDPDKHPDLERWTIGDSYLADAIDLLSRSKLNGGKKGFVDYSTLEIRHLGSIYEGLLEYKLEVAEDDLVVTKGKERKWLSLEEFNKDKKKKVTLEEIEEFDRARKGQMYLTTDRGERKATGSYYTPDYIVNYIVENTVGPVVEERWKQALMENKSLIEATLSVKVLDPAMGSGHFLVGTVEFLAGKLMRAAERDIEWGWVEERGQFTNEWAKREIVSHCIYGVDLNELAVELAKVSLWLITIAQEKPLSFLDHRLKQGNSLIGAKLSDLKYYPGNKNQTRDQVTLPSFVSPLFIQHLISKIKELEGIGDDTLTEIKRKEGVFEEFKRLPEYIRARNIANVHTSVYFGNEVTPITREGKEIKSADGVYHDLFWAVGGDDAEWRRKTFGQWFQHVQNIAEERHFFHWELEFPEIFFEAGEVKNNPGFEVVIGNPPYVRQERLGEDKRYLESNFKVYHSIADLYVYFIERGVSMLNSDGVFSYIVANKWMRANYGEPLRIWLKDQRIEEIVDFGDLSVFSEASTYPCIMRINKSTPSTSFEVIQVKTLDFRSLNDYIKENYYIVNQSDLDDHGWSLADERTQVLLAKMNSRGVPLGEYVSGKVYRGVLTGLNDAFVIDKKTRNKLVMEEPKNAELIKPFLVGRNIKRYEPPYSNDYLILIPSGWTRAHLSGTRDAWTWFKENYPSLATHLSRFSEDAQKRYDKGEYWWELRSCDYYDDFEKQKIIFPDISIQGNFTLDIEGEYYSVNTTYIIISEDRYLLSLLNSSLLTFYYRNLLSTYRGGYLRFFTQYLVQLPIRRIYFTTPLPERIRLGTELQQLYGAGKYDEVLARAEACLPKDATGNLILEQEKSDVVQDLLAFLAERMLEMNKQKQQEIRGFLGWLESYVGAKIETLSNKTKIEAYFEGEFKEFLEVLKKNRKKLSSDPARRQFQENLEKEFKDSISKLRPLLTKIEETDQLIDQIVYKLYGLTDKEIRIVKEQSSVKVNSNRNS